MATNRQPAKPVKVFVAGATGALGTRLVWLLVRSGYDVVGVMRSPGKTGHVQAMGARPIVADGLDRDAVSGDEPAISMFTQIRGASNAKAKRTLAWQPLYASWRDGFRRGLAADPAEMHCGRAGTRSTCADDHRRAGRRPN
jgi:hypothetical protein